MKRLLAAFVALFGIICAIIGMTHVVFGPSSIPGSVPVNATMDSEDRFYATLFVAFGIALFWCSRDLGERRGIFFALLATFFASGLARIVSLLAAGPPHPLFQFLTGVELGLPVLLWLWHRRVFAVA
jgi:apolipoprotein N-acyltransferase